ncbi:hypothetical protein SCUCBS95973_004700 [Sporothrix curviconia]|uniref:Uncharacterized protein n=1 Tax=Sporothrix curviconia TaxID=1260050 RepID=A0ABP0BQP9_9PEZI
MTRKNIDSAPLHETGNAVQDHILVNGGKPVVTKAAVRTPIVVHDAPVEMETDNESGDDDIPETQPAGVTFVTDVQPMKRQKTGFEPSPNFQDSFVGMPMDNTGITSGLPPAPPPTPDIPQFKFTMPTPNQKGATKTRAQARKELQENVKNGVPLGDDLDPEDVNDAVTLVNTEANTPPGGRLKRYHSKAADSGSATSSNSDSPRSSGASCPKNSKKRIMAEKRNSEKRNSEKRKSSSGSAKA